jgi:uncharacterized protein (DUF1778 family)
MPDQLTNFSKSTVEKSEDQHTYLLNGKRWEEFLEILDRPTRIKPRLARLFAERSVLE